MTNILIIDDSPEDLEFYSDLIERSDKDYQVFSAENAEVGIALFDKHRIDCTFIDYYLPEVNGLHVLEMLNKKNGNKVLPLIILTGDPDQRIQAEAARRGALDYLIKGRDTCTPSQIKGVINKVISWASELSVRQT